MEDQQIENLTWLKLVQQSKLKNLIDDAKTLRDSKEIPLKEEIPKEKITVISSGQDKSHLSDKGDAEEDTKGDRDKDVSEIQENVHAKHLQTQQAKHLKTQLEIIEHTVQDTKVQEDTSVIEKKWETISTEKAEACRQKAIQRGGKPLNTSRLNMVGEGLT